MLLSMESDSALPIDGRTEYVVPANNVRPVPEPLQCVAVFDDVIDSKEKLVPSKALTDAAYKCEFQFDDGWWRVAVRGREFSRSRLEVVYEGFGTDPDKKITHTTELSKLRPILEYNRRLGFLPVKLGLLSSPLQGMGSDEGLEESARKEMREAKWRKEERAKSKRSKEEAARESREQRKNELLKERAESQQRKKERAESQQRKTARAVSLSDLQ